MATTYSTSLKIALIGDGEQAGIWGQTTNTNLGTLLEQAITGVQSIVMVDADYTLTNFNGVSNEARNPVLVVTGTNNAIRDIIAPLVNKQYLVVNNTTNGFAIRIRGASGFTVTVPNGAKIPVYCDGTNFYSVESNVTGGDFTINGNATVTGNVAVNQNILVGKTLSGTYSQSSTTVTVTIASHGLVAGNPIAVDITSGTGVDGTYSVATVTGTNTFTYTAGTSLTTSGNILVACGSLVLPVGTTTQRNSPAATGMVRFNTTQTQFEGYNGTVWTSIGGAQAGGAVYENKQTISADYTMTTNFNGESVGPITIDSGVTVTIPSGSRWVVL